MSSPVFSWCQFSLITEIQIKYIIWCNPVPDYQISTSFCIIQLSCHYKHLWWTCHCISVEMKMLSYDGNMVSEMDPWPGCATCAGTQDTLHIILDQMNVVDISDEPANLPMSDAGSVWSNLWPCSVTGTYIGKHASKEWGHRVQPYFTCDNLSDFSRDRIGYIIFISILYMLNYDEVSSI